MSDQPRPKHEFEHDVAPAVVHHDPVDETMLAAWLRRSMAQGPKFWGLTLGLVALAFAAFYFGIGLVAGKVETNQEWTELMLAKDDDDRLRVAEQSEFPIEPWALIQGAEGRYREGFADLPGNRDAAMPLLSRAVELFTDAERKSPPGSATRRIAALGMARALEARNEIGKALDQYRAVAKVYPEEAEGKLAAKLAERLARPESAEFYKKLFAFEPKKAEMPGLPGSSGSLLPPGRPLDLGMPTLGTDPISKDFKPSPLPKMSDLIPRPEADKPAMPVVEPAKVEPPATKPAVDLPANPFAAAKPAVEPPKADAPPAKSAGELPANPFAGAPKR